MPDLLREPRHSWPPAVRVSGRRWSGRCHASVALVVTLLTVGCAGGSDESGCVEVVAATTFAEGDLDVVLIDREGVAHNVTRDGRTFQPSLDRAASRLAATRGLGDYSDGLGWPATTVVVLNIDGTERERWDVTDEYGRVESPAWSPTADQLAVVAGKHIETQSVMIGPLDGSTLRAVAKGTRIAPPAWSPDGKRLAFTVEVSDQRVLRIVDVSSGRARDLHGDLGQGYRFVDWSTDGDTLLVSWTFEDNTGRTQFVDVETGLVTKTAKGDSMVDHSGGRTWIENRSSGIEGSQSLVTADGSGRLEVPIQAENPIADLNIACGRGRT